MIPSHPQWNIYNPQPPQGDWVNGRREGFGIYRSKDGKEYVGESTNKQQHGGGGAHGKKWWQ